MPPRKKPAEETVDTLSVQKNIPASELQAPGVYCRAKNNNYVITSNAYREKFTLWKEVEGGVVRMATASSPLKLYEQIPWFGEQKGKSTTKK